EERIDNAQQCFAASEIIRQGNACAAAARLAPALVVLAEDFWVGEAEPIDALLNVADQKTIRLCVLAAESDKDRILGAVDVLALIHENEPQPLLPLPGNRAVAQQAKRKLFQVGKINTTQFTLRFAEGGAELARQPQQCADVWPGPLPILKQGVFQSSET